MADERLYSIKLGLDATAGARNMRQFHSLFNKTLKEMGENAPDIKAFKEMAKQAETSETALVGVDREMADLVRSYNDLKAEASARDKLKFIPDKEIERQVSAVRGHFATLKKSGKLSAKELARAYDETENQIRSLRGETAKSAATTEGALKRIAKQALAVTAAFFGIREIGRSAASILKTGDQFERLSVQLESLTGSSEEASRSLDWIKNFTQNTPLQLEQVTEQFTKLKAFGLDPMDGTLQTLVDANERLGGGMERLNGIVLAFGQAWAKQKLQGEEILQLVERGIPVWETLEKVTGKNTAELQKLSSAGELGRETIQQLMDELGQQSAGAAAKNMTLLSGYVSNLKDEWQLFLAEIADAGVLEHAKAQLADLLATIKEMKENGQLQAWAKGISDAMIAISTAAKNTTAFIVRFKDELLFLIQVVAGTKLIGALGKASAGFASMGIAMKQAQGIAGKTGSKFNRLTGVLKGIPSNLTIAVAITGFTVAFKAGQKLRDVLDGTTQALEHLQEAQARYQQTSANLALAFAEEAANLKAVRDLEYQNADALLQMSGSQRTYYAERLQGMKDYLALKVKEADARREAGQEITKELQRAIELYNGHKKALDELEKAQTFIARAIDNGLSIAAQKAVDHFIRLQAEGLSAADALKTVGSSLDLSDTADLRTFNALLKETGTTGQTMSNDLREALGSVIGDLDVSGLEQLRTVINNTFDNAEDRARALGAVLQAGLADELKRLGLSFAELETGIDASAQQAVKDFAAVVQVIKETGTESDIAQQKIIEAYQAARGQAGESEEAIQQLDQALKDAGDAGVLSQDAVAEAIADTGQEAEKTAETIVQSSQQAAQGVKQVATAAQDVGDELDKTSQRAAGLAQVVADYLNATVEGLNQLSAQTAQLFNANMGFDTTPIQNDVDQLKTSLQQAQDAAIAAQTDIGSIGVDTTGLNHFVQQVDAASNQAAAAFYRQKLAYQDLMADISNGDLTGNDLIAAAELAISRFDQLNNSDLSALQSAISNARREMEALSDSADSTLVGLQNELDRLRGNQEAIEQRQYEQKKAELLALIQEAEAAQNSDAAADYREALAVLEQIRREKEQQRLNDEKNRQQQQAQAPNEPARPSNQAKPPQSTTPDRTINLKLPDGNNAQVSGDADDIDALLDYLAQAEMSTTI